MSTSYGLTGVSGAGITGAADAGSGLDSGRRIAVAAGVAALGYYLGSLLGLGLQVMPMAVSSLWPANAFLLGVLLVTRRRGWWLILVAIVPAHLLAHGPAGVPLSIMPVQLASNIAQATLSAVAFQYLAGERPRLEKLTTMGLFIAIAAIAVPAVASFLAASVFEAVGWKSDLWTTWRIRFQSNALATLTITPLVVLAWEKGNAAFTGRTIRRTLGAIAIAAGIAGTGYWIAVTFATAALSLPLLYLPVPIVLLATIRFGLAGACLSVLLLGTVMVWGALHSGPFVVALSPIDRALAFSLFLIVTAIPLLLLAALLEERNRAQRRVSESRQDLQELMENTAAIPWHADLETLAVTYMGPQAAQLFGYPLHAWRRRDFWLSRLHPEDRGLAQTIREKAASGAEALDFDCRMSTSSGRTVWLHNTVRFEHENGGCPRLRGFMIDITGRKLAESEGQRHREEIARLNRKATMGEFTASITHDLIQPLSAVLTSAQAAEMFLKAEPPALGDALEALADIRNDDRRAAEIIRRTRNLLRRHEIVRKAVDMNALVSEIIALLNVEAETRSIQVRFEPDPRLPAVSGDRVHLQQVMMNLALNAFEAMIDVPESTRELTVRTAHDENGTASVTISDTGPGIDAHMLPKLFEPFCTTKADGLGMGLSITRTIVEAHQGRIRAANNPKTGATFGFTLPLHERASP